MSEKVGSIYYEVDADTSKLTTGADRVNAALDGIQKGADKADAAFVNFGKDLRDATTAVDKATTGIGKTGAALDGVQKGVDKADAAVVKFGKDLRETAIASDAESNALRKLLGQIDPVVAATQRLDNLTKQLGQSFDKGHLSAKDYEANLAKLDVQYKKLDSSASATRVTTAGFGAALTPLAAIIAGTISVQTLANWGKMAEQFTMMQARIARLSPSLDIAATSYNSLLTISAKTGSTMANTTKLWEGLTSTLKSFGATNSQVLQLTETLQKVGVVGGSSGEEIARAMRQLQQSLAGGTLRAEEFNSIVENTPELARQLAKGFGVSMGQLRQMMLDGKISAEQLFDVMLGRTAEVNAEFDKLPGTVSRAANAITTQFGAALSVIDKTTGASQLLAKAMEAVAVGIQRTLNPTEEVKLNDLIRERADLYDAFAKRKGSWDEGGMTARNQAEQLKQIEKEILEIQNRRFAQQKAESADAAKAAQPKVAADTSIHGQKEIKRLTDEAAALKVQGVERAQILAVQKLGAGATEKEIAQARILAAEIYKQQEAEKQTKKDKTAAASQATKEANAAAAELRKAAQERKVAGEQDTKKFTELGQSLAKVGQSAREAAQDTAQLSLSKFATPDEVQRIRDMAGALYDLKGAKSALATADPIANQQQQFDEQMKQLDMLHNAKGAYALDDIRYGELKHQAEVANATQMRLLQEENFKAQALGNQIMFNSIDAVGQAGTQAISGLLSGTASLKDAMGGIANTVTNAVIGSFVQMGVNWVKQQIMMAAASQATTATQVAGIGTVAGVQVGATTAIAATTTTAAAATGTAVSASMAPAAGLSSIASFGGAAVIGGAALLATMLLAKSFGGGRQYGGAVDGSKMYQVNEGGAPEIFNAANGNQYMMPNSRGEVVSNKDATAGGGASAGTEVNIHNYTGGSASVSRSQGMNGRDIVDIIIQDLATGGPVSRSVNQITGTKRQGV